MLCVVIGTMGVDIDRFYNNKHGHPLFCVRGCELFKFDGFTVLEVDDDGPVIPICTPDD